MKGYSTRLEKERKTDTNTAGFLSEVFKESNYFGVEKVDCVAPRKRRADWPEIQVMARQRLLTRTFKSLKPHQSTSDPILSSPKVQPFTLLSRWVVYLILSSNPPVKTYVGVTNNFSRRLKQHNGELKGGAKASRAGRPWICACLIHGFQNKSTACKVESKWKSFSRKVTWKRRSENEEQADDAKLFLLQRRNAALNQVKDSMNFSNLDIHWHLDLVPV